MTQCNKRGKNTYTHIQRVHSNYSGCDKHKWKFIFDNKKGLCTNWHTVDLFSMRYSINTFCSEIVSNCAACNTFASSSSYHVWFSTLSCLVFYMYNNLYRIYITIDYVVYLKFGYFKYFIIYKGSSLC